MFVNPNRPCASTIGYGPVGGASSAVASGMPPGTSASTGEPLGALPQPAAITTTNANPLRTSGIVGATNFGSIGIERELELTIVRPGVLRGTYTTSDADVCPRRSGRARRGS